MQDSSSLLLVLSPDLAGARRCCSGNPCQCRLVGWLRGELRAVAAVAFQPSRRSAGDSCHLKPFQTPPGAAAITECSCCPVMSPECRNSAPGHVDESASPVTCWPPSNLEPTAGIRTEPLNPKARADTLCLPPWLPPESLHKYQWPVGPREHARYSSVSAHIKKEYFCRSKIILRRGKK